MTHKLDTLFVQGAIKPDPSTGSILPPIYQTATYALDEIGHLKGYDYTRSANPTRQMLEESLAVIEGGKYGVCFASGLAATDSCFRLLSQGDHLICSKDVYGGVTRLLTKITVRSGIEISLVDTSKVSEVQAALKSNTKMLWVETPANPLLTVSDLKALGKLAKERKLIFAVDSTFATPALLRPLEYGVDLVVHSTTKFVSGHNQIIGGAVILNDQNIFDELKLIQRSVGAVPSPFDCWLALSGLRTLGIRMERHCQNAVEVANFLEKHPLISRVLYPGLPSHPQYNVAKEQMSAGGGMISFELRGDVEQGIKFMNNLKLCKIAESLGSVETMVTHPASMTHKSVPIADRLAIGLTDGLIRISVGIEDVGDILADLKQSLDSLQSERPAMAANGLSA